MPGLQRGTAQKAFADAKASGARKETHDPASRNSGALNEDQPLSLAEDAFGILEEMIVTLALPPGAHLTERKLCEQFGLGRTPVREAVQRLAQGGLVEVMPRQGIRVTPIDPEQELMVLELRDLVERLVVTRAATLSTTFERKRLLRMADAIEAAADRDDLIAFMRIDDAFNRFVAECARHPHAARVLAPLHALARRLGCAHYGRGDRAIKLRSAAEAHGSLMRAIASGDERRTGDLLTQLLKRSEAIIDGLDTY